MSFVFSLSRLREHAEEIPRSGHAQETALLTSRVRRNVRWPAVERNCRDSSAPKERGPQNDRGPGFLVFRSGRARMVWTALARRRARVSGFLASSNASVYSR